MLNLSSDTLELIKEKNIDIRTLGKIATNYLVLSIGWGNDFILPYEDGIKLIDSLKHAEHIQSSSNGYIIPVSENHITYKVVSETEYKLRKLAAALKIDAKELLEYS